MLFQILKFTVFIDLALRSSLDKFARQANSQKLDCRIVEMGLLFFLFDSGTLLRSVRYIVARHRV